MNTPFQIKAVLLSASVLCSAHAFAENTPRQIDVKSTMIQRCASETVAAKIASNADAKKLCTCTINVQANNLKLGEFWAIQSASISGQDPRDIPAFKRVQPQLEKCRTGIKLNLPLAPEPQTAPAK